MSLGGFTVQSWGLAPSGALSIAIASFGFRVFRLVTLAS